MLGEFSRCKICYLIQLRLPYHFFFTERLPNCCWIRKIMKSLIVSYLTCHFFLSLVNKSPNFTITLIPWLFLDQHHLIQACLFCFKVFLSTFVTVSESKKKWF